MTTADLVVLEWSGEASVYWPDRPGGYCPTPGEIVQAWNALRLRYLAMIAERDRYKAALAAIAVTTFDANARAIAALDRR